MAGTERRARIIIEARDDASRTLAHIGQSQDRLGQSLGNFGNIAKGALIGFAGAALAGVAASVKLGMSMEQTRMAFTSMLGSAQAASKHLEELRAFAAKTPFQFTELTDASRRLQAFGFEAQNIVPMLRDIGDAVAAMGGNSQMIDRVTLALGQMSAKGKVSGQEMLQLTEAGIPAWRYLAVAVGVSTAEVQKMTEKGLIPADKAIQAILAGMREDFGGMMENQSKTAAGAISNLVDTMEEIGTTIGELVLPAFKEFLRLAKEGTDTLKRLVNWEKDLHAVFQTHQKDMFALVTATDDTRISVEEYNKEIIRSGLLTGDITKYTYDAAAALRDQYSSAELAQQGYIEMDDGIYKLNRDVRIFTEESLSALQRGMIDQASSTDEGARALKRYTQAGGELEGSLGDLTSKTKTFADMLGDVDTRLGILKDIMGGAVGKELQDFKEAQEANRAKAAELKEELAKVPEGTARWGEIKGQLDELNGEFAKNASEHEKATGRILFDIAAQQLAMDGLTKTEVFALRSLAVEWGLMDEATANAVQNTLGAVLQLSEDQSLPNFRKNMSDAREEALRFGDELGRLPREIDIRINLQTEGTLPNLPVGAEPLPFQRGGAMRAGQVGLVGERGPEWFVPRMPGFVVNQQQAAGAVAAERGPRSVQNITNNVTINDRLAAALFFEEQRRQTRGRIEDVM